MTSIKIYKIPRNILYPVSMCLLIIFVPFYFFVHQKKVVQRESAHYQRQITEILGHRENKHESKLQVAKLNLFVGLLEFLGFFKDKV